MFSKKILLVEDDFLNRRLIKKTLVNSGYEVLESKNAEEAHRILKKIAINLIILDINLKEGKEEGILLGNQIKEQYKIPFIYLTAYTDLSIVTQASLTSPYSYLTKPFKDIDLIAGVEIALQRVSNSTENTKRSIQVKNKEHLLEISLESIDYIESAGNYLKCYVGKRNYLYRSTIKQILELADNIPFIQVHRAFLVNKNKIEKYNSQVVVVVGGTEISISRKFKKNIVRSS